MGDFSFLILLEIQSFRQSKWIYLTEPEHLHSETRGLLNYSVLSKHSLHCPSPAFAADYTNIDLSFLSVYSRSVTIIVGFLVEEFVILFLTISLNFTFVLPIFIISPSSNCISYPSPSTFHTKCYPYSSTSGLSNNYRITISLKLFSYIRYSG